SRAPRCACRIASVNYKPSTHNYEHCIHQRRRQRPGQARPAARRFTMRENSRRAQGRKRRLGHDAGARPGQRQLQHPFAHRRTAPRSRLSDRKRNRRERSPARFQTPPRSYRQSMSNEAAIIDWSETRRMAADMISKAEEILRLCAAHAPAKASYSPRLKLVRSVVAAHYGLTSDAILKADRRAPVAWARSTAMFL